MSQSRSEQEVLQAILGVAQNTSDTIKKAMSTLEDLLKSEYQHNRELTNTMTLASTLSGNPVSNDIKPIALSMTDSINTMLNQYAEKNKSIMEIKHTIELMNGTSQDNPETLKRLESHLNELSQKNESTTKTLPVLLEKIMIDGDANVAPKGLVENLMSAKDALDSQIKTLNERVAELKQSMQTTHGKTQDKTQERPNENTNSFRKG